MAELAVDDFAISVDADDVIVHLFRPEVRAFYESNAQEFDLGERVRARQILDEAGWKPGSDGIRTSGARRLTLTFIGGPAVPDQVAWSPRPAAGRGMGCAGTARAPITPAAGGSTVMGDGIRRD